VHTISFINIESLEGSFQQNEENGRGGSKRKSVAALEKTAEVSKKPTGDERDNSKSTGKNDVNNIQEENTTMEDGEHDGEE